MNSITLSAFSDELEKVAAGPKIVDHPGLFSEHRRIGHYFPAKAMEHPLNATIRAQSGVQPGRGLVLMAPQSEIEAVPGVVPEGAKRIQKSYRRHELTHWKRDQMGKMKGVAEPGLRNVLRTAREEGIANIQGAKSLLKSGVPPKAVGVNAGQSFVGSMRGAYPGGLGQAALGGKFGKVVKPIMSLAKRFRR